MVSTFASTMGGAIVVGLILYLLSQRLDLIPASLGIPVDWGGQERVLPFGAVSLHTPSAAAPSSRSCSAAEWPARTRISSHEVQTVTQMSSPVGAAATQRAEWTRAESVFAASIFPIVMIGAIGAASC